MIGRLKSVWQQEYEHWQKRSLSGKRYVYFWADGVYCNVRMDDKQCLLVIVDTTVDGEKELLRDVYTLSVHWWGKIIN
jgi:putative transposase